MSYKSLFYLGITTLLAASLMPTLTARATTNSIQNDYRLPLHSVDYHQHSRVYLEKSQSMNLVFASEDTKSSGVPQDSSRPPRG
ncbi:hypothetical protein ACL6C3_25680 [Capilliphycus salinus ALCB114379]|uniref:hypothetical protein n=1 Tax=Capilliphycus salinus TaxID=2768948 RepID=UPI0039A4905E